MMNVVIYTRQGCGFCARAKQLLNAKNVSFTEYDATIEPAYRAEMMERSGRHTFPQIFVGEYHVGGCDDLYALENDGKLDHLLTTGQLA